MSKAPGEIIEAPAGELPYKAVIKVDEKIVGVQFFDSRVRAEIFIVETLKGLEDVARKEGGLREFAASSNGDRWYLGRNDDTMHAYVVHKANLPSAAPASPDFVLEAQRPAQPHRRVGIERPIRLADGSYPKVVRPSAQRAVHFAHQRRGLLPCARSAG